MQGLTSEPACMLHSYRSKYSSHSNGKDKLSIHQRPSIDVMAGIPLWELP